MSVGKIALGVFLGNLAMAILSLMIYSFLVQGERRQATIDSVDAQYNAMLESKRLEAGDRN